MKYCKYILFIIFICFFIFSSSACAVRENDVEISTFLKIDDMGSGSRELYVSFCADLLKDEQSVLEIDKMISNNCPQQLSYVKSQNSDNLVYIFYLNFASFEEYVYKVNCILGFDPGIVYSRQDNIFSKGTKFCENFSSEDLLKWIEDFCKASNNNHIQKLSLSCLKTSICLDDITKITDEYINVNSMEGLQIDKIEVETINKGNNKFDRTFIFKIPHSTIEYLGEENIILYFNMRNIECSRFLCNNYKSGNEYIITFENIDIDKLNQHTKDIFNSYDSSLITYSHSNDYTAMLCEENSFNESLDLSSFCGKNNSAIDLSYRYILQDSENDILTAQKYSKGNWIDSNEVDRKSVIFEEKSHSLKVDISDGFEYDVMRAQVQLDMLDDNYFTRYIDLYLENEEAYENIDEYLKAKNSEFDIEKISGSSYIVCRLSITGSSEEITQAQLDILGDGNSLKLQQKENKIYAIHNVNTIIDSMELSNIISEDMKEIEYSTNVLNGRYFDSVMHSQDNVNYTNINVKQSDSKNVSFELKSKKSVVILNLYKANPIAVFFILFLIILIIIIVFYIIFKVKNSLPVFPTIKNIIHQKEESFADATDDEIIDILYKL